MPPITITPPVTGAVETNAAPPKMVPIVRAVPARSFAPAAPMCAPLLLAKLSQALAVCGIASGILPKSDGLMLFIPTFTVDD